MDYKGFQIQINPLLKLSEQEPFFPLEALAISLQLESKKARPLVLSISSSFSFVCTQYHLHNL